MGFYTNIYDNKELKRNKFNDRWSGKWVGGYELYKWCFENIKNKWVTIYEDMFCSEGYFIITIETLELIIKEEVMGKINSNAVAKKLLIYMQENNLKEIYFQGDY